MTKFHKHLAAAAALAAYLAAPASAFAQSATVIELTQTPCQFLESENGVDHGYQSAQQSDCETVNAQTANARLAEAKVFTLKPGRYIFRVRNQNVSYPLGFWLRGDGLVGRATLPSVSGGGLTQGTTRDYEITLKPGEYVYSCPLNPTPDYKLRVED
ncbi:MAG: hypothetical protein OEQ39_05590 [Gammaproteobacteria bacterium]|nr:hypothetical protein [Gammaproteobacteria bacterium]MDH3467180.1 hypothetical protein [Gammaproteobacteria bacterium]